MSLHNFARASVIRGFPRVSGDEPVLLAVVAVVVSFSPRERG